MNKSITITGLVFGALSVVIGAFAAHQLKATMSADNLQLIQTAVTYQMYHALLLVVVGLASSKIGNAAKTVSFCLIAGNILFAGSLFLIAYCKEHQMTVGAWGILTPIGGLCYIAGWLLLALMVFKNQSTQV